MIGSDSAVGRRLAVQASWLRTSTLGSVFAIAASFSATSLAAALSSPTSRTAQLRTNGSEWERAFIAKALSKPPI